MIRPRLSMLGAALAGACTAVPDPTIRDFGLELPDRFTAAAEEQQGGTPPGLWWRRFEDPALTQAVEEALVHNRDLGASAARLDAALARANIAGADLWPHLNGGVGISRARTNLIGLPFGGGSDVLDITNSQQSWSLDVSWELDLWGRIRAGEIAATADVEAALADLRGARLSIAARTAKAWFGCVESAQQLRLAQDTASSFRRTEEQVGRRFAAGVRSALDARLARADREDAEALVERRRRELDSRLRRLQVLIGRYPDAAIDPGATLPNAPVTVPAGLPSELLRRRPDLIAAERRLAAADGRYAQAEADLYPRISLTASGGASSNDLQDLTNFDFRVWSLGANLLVPIFQGGRLRANVDLRDAERREALAGFSSAVLVALVEVETALAAESVLAAEESRRRSAAAEAEAAQRLSEDRYGRGLIDINTLLTSQRRTLGSRTQLLAVRRLRLDTRIDLLLALGGGLEPASDTGAEGATHP